jgi:hypothetical protein
MKHKDLRKTVLIDRGFQLRMILKFILLNFSLMVIFGFFIYLFFNSEIESNLRSAHVTYKNIKEMLFPIVLTLSIINIFVSSLIIFFIVLFASHKIAGPMYRFNETLKEICNRNICKPVSIREGDQLYECMNTLNEFSGLLSNDFSELKDKVHELKERIDKKISKKELSSRVQVLQDILDQYK